MTERLHSVLKRLKQWLASLTFRTGVCVGAVCLLCYALSFAQMLLPVSVAVKSALWILLFGMAKAAQYAALLILGKEGVRRVMARLRGRTKKSHT